MAISTKTIKNRIGSVQNIKKITNAMEMVAAAKMRRAVESATSTRSYAELALELLIHISKERNARHPLLNSSKEEKILLVLVASNKGLCGGFNANLNKEALNFINNHHDKKIDIICVGKKAEITAKRSQKNILASFIDFSDTLHFEETQSLSQMIIDEFTSQKYNAVYLTYTNFISSIKYEALTRKLLPITQENIQSTINQTGHDPKQQNGITEQKNKDYRSMAEYLFEPDPETILNLVLPELSKVQLYQSLLESLASEHSARMMAMKNAGDSAREMLDDLNLSFNRARQASITQEIAEISSGAAALSNS